MRFNAAIIAIATLALTASISIAQTFEHALGTPASESANFIAPTSGGGYVITGRQFSGGVNTPYVALVDASDSFVWQRHITGTPDLAITDVVEGPDGSIVCAYSDPNLPGFGRGAFKLSATGVVLWRRSFPGSHIFADIKIAPIPTGGYIFTGIYDSVLAASRHPVLTRIDENGALLWTRIYNHVTLGANLNAKLEDVCPFTLSPTEQTFFACGTLSTVGAPNDEGRALVMRLNDSGDVVWASSYGYPDNTLLEATNIDIANNLDLILGGNDLTIGDSCLVRLDSSGAFLWENIYQFFGTGGSMTLLPSGDIIMCGRTRNPAIPGGQAETVLLSAQAGGALNWARAYGGAGFAFGLDAAPVPSGFVCIGTKITGNPSGSADIQWVRTDADGRTGCETDEPVNILPRTPTRAAEPFNASTNLETSATGILANPVTYTIDPTCDAPPCPTCACQFAPPTTQCDFSDVVAFLTLFSAQDPCADLAPPSTSWDFSDVVAFLSSFGANCN